MEEVQKKAFLMMESKIVINIFVLLFNGRARDNVSTVQRTQSKESENGFQELSWETIIYCLSIKVRFDT